MFIKKDRGRFSVLSFIQTENRPLPFPDWIETMTNLKILALDGTTIVEKSPRVAWLSDLYRKKQGSGWS